MKTLIGIIINLPWRLISRHRRNKFFFGPLLWSKEELRRLPYGLHL